MTTPANPAIPDDVDVCMKQEQDRATFLIVYTQKNAVKIIVNAIINIESEGNA